MQPTLSDALPSSLLCAVLFVALPVSGQAAPLDGDGRSPGDDRQKRLVSALCEGEPSFCDCSGDATTGGPTVAHATAGQFVDPEAFELAVHLEHCGSAATAVFRRTPTDDGDAPETWSLVGLYREVHTQTCRRFDFEGRSDRLICHRTVEGDTWRVGFFHALAFSNDGIERRQLTSYQSNARGCPSDVLRTEHPLGWRTWHRPSDPRAPLLTVFFQHHNGPVPDRFADACEAMRHGEPVFGRKRRVTEYFEWSDGRFTFAGATRMREDQKAASWTTPERIDAPICRRRDALAQIRDHRRALRNCYAKALEAGESASGILKLKWTVGAEGSVDAIEVLEDGPDNERLRTCVRRVVAEMEFPPPRGGDTCSFVYPFEFVESGGE